MTSNPYQTDILMHILPTLLPILGTMAALDMAMHITNHMAPEEQLSYVQKHLPELLI